MPTVEIPDDVYAALEERARANQCTVEEQAVKDLAPNPDMSNWTRHQVIEWLRHAPSVLPKGAPDPVELIREDRDR